VEPSINVLGTPLTTCSQSPKTGYWRDGCCNTGPEDRGAHTVCVVASAAFLQFSKEAGNDLSTPNPMYGFPGVRPGQKWCLCAARWREALIAGVAPPVVLESTHQRTLEYVSLEDLVLYAIDTELQ
jgi:hypothetical protein